MDCVRRSEMSQSAKKSIKRLASTGNGFHVRLAGLGTQSDGQIFEQWKR